MPAKTKELDVIFHKYMLMVQDQYPNLVGPEIDVVVSYSLRRSLRRGSTAQARNKGIPKDIIALNNRWRSEEESRNRVTQTGDMVEYYTDAVVAIEALLKYSERL